MATAARRLATRLDGWAAKVYRPIGFTKPYNFILWFLSTSGLFGFVLSRLPYLNYDGVFCAPITEHTDRHLHPAPGECYYHQRGHTRVGMLMHLATILPAGLLVCLQFVPFIRHRWILLHRIVGYLVILLSFASTAGAFMVVRFSFGGDPDTQVFLGVLGSVFLLALALAYINIKRLQIEQHRKWMLRAWFYACSIITLRVISILGTPVMTRTGTYYTARACKIVDDIMHNNQSLALAFYPDCQAWYNGTDPEQFVLVHGDAKGNPVEAIAAAGMMFSAAGWLALTLHAIGIEIYLQLTPAEHERLRNVSYQRQVQAGMNHPGRAGLTADRLGDSATWRPE
ncbi:hypothetical protein B0T24DRAFT_504428, partial [Lasiosphaeria ovina]